MQDNDDKIEMKEIETEDGEKVLAAAVPYATPAIRGAWTAAIYALLVVGTIGAIFDPTGAVSFAVANGIAALGWFTLYRIASSGAARYANKSAMLQVMYHAELRSMQAYVNDIIEKKDGTKSDDIGLSKDENENPEDSTEPK